MIRLGYFSILHIYVFWCKCSYIWRTVSLCRQLRSRSFWRFLRAKSQFIIFGFKLWKQWDDFMSKLWPVYKWTWLVPNWPIVRIFWPHFHVSFSRCLSDLGSESKEIFKRNLFFRSKTHFLYSSSSATLIELSYKAKRVAFEDMLRSAA